MKKVKNISNNIEKKLEKEFYVEQINSDLDYKEFGSFNKTVQTKQDFEYFIEESHICYPVLRIKRISKSDEEKWKISLDSKICLVIDSTSLTEGECKFLRTSEGFNFLLEMFKSGVKTMQTIKKEMAPLLVS